ncbi:hypothetical protein BGP_5155 [Beggiatoa sp. PS]|nr:hypothetical protein BGP_5155 [Beggiatoa sp. PS]
MVRPYPTGTYTLQEIPNFAWRTENSQILEILIQTIDGFSGGSGGVYPFIPLIYCT